MNVAVIDMDSPRNIFWGAGQAKSTGEMCRRLVSKGHAVTVFTSKYPAYRDYEENGIRYIHVGLRGHGARMTNLFFLLSIPFIARRISADVILENFNAPTSVGMAPLFTRIPVVGIGTTFDANQFTRRYWLPFHIIEKYGSRCYRYFISYTEAYREKMKRFNPNVVTGVIPEGVDDECFTVSQKDPKHILYLGRFDIGQKGIDLLLRAYAEVRNSIPYPLVLAGHGQDEKRIKGLITELGIGDRVRIIGPAYGEKKREALSEAAFVAFPSRYEGFSVFALEALAAGLPLVAFDIPGLSWNDSSVALKTTPFDVNEYAKSLERMSLDRSLRVDMGTKAKAFAKNFSWDSVADEYETFLKRVVEHETSGK